MATTNIVYVNDQLGSIFRIGNDGNVNQFGQNTEVYGN